MSRKAVSARVLESHRLEVSRSDGTSIVIDLEPYLERGVFRALQDPELLMQVQIDRLGGAEWPNGASLPPELLAADQSETVRSAAPARAN